MSTARKLAGETTVYGVSTIAQRLLSSLLTPLYTRAYLPKVYSIFSTMFSYASIFQALLAFGMETTFFRYINKFPDKKKLVYNNGFGIIGAVSLLFLLTAFPLAHALAGLIRIGNDTTQHDFELFIKYFIGVLVLDAWCVIPFAKLRADGRPSKYGYIKGVNILVTVLLNLIFILGIPFWVKHGFYGGARLAEWYVPCARLSIFLSLFNQVFRMGVEPFFFSHAKNQHAGQTYARIMDYFVITMCLMFVGVVANIDILKHYIDNKAYWVGLNVVPPLLFGYVSLGIYMNLSVWYKLSDQTRYGLYISGIGAITTILLNVVFIPRYSYMASAWTSFIAYTMMMILSYWWGQKNYPIPYKLKKGLAYIAVSVLLVYLSFYVFKRNLIIGNGLFVLFAFSALYLEWDYLKTLFMRSGEK